MAKYDGNGNPVNACYGVYKIADIEIFRHSGFVDVDENLARKISEDLAERIKNGALKY